jgi:prepilin-type N-terminal cleavage/methylation domain-containing protein
MGCASKQNQHGFTLVEISIVMIIIGLLIGGTFGGMKLIENMQINKTLQDLKAIESAALTFKDTYGRLPGDMPNTAARLPNCTVAPCATGGNGNRIVGATDAKGSAITNADENFTFWHHLQAADLLALGTKNTLDMNFGEGQPNGPLAGYRVADFVGTWIGPEILQRTVIYVNDMPSAVMTGGAGTLWAIPCPKIQSVDLKMDDGVPYNGLLKGWACTSPAAVNVPYEPSFIGAIIYDLKGV